jgi:hypothetical protein
MRKIKISAIALLVFVAFAFTACSSTEKVTDDTAGEAEDNGVCPTGEDTAGVVSGGVSYSFLQLTFEELILDYATDVVVAQYVGHKPFGEEEKLLEYEFIVLDRVVGNAPDRIFIYGRIPDPNDFGNLEALNIPGGFTDARYLLPIRQLGWLFGHTHEDGYEFLRSLVINLDDLSRSTMFGEPLSDHTDVLDFTSSRAADDSVVEYFEQLTRNRHRPTEPVAEFIRSTNTDEILSGSPFVLEIEIDEFLSAQRSDWGAWDFCTAVVVESLKGDIERGFKIWLAFAPGSVKPGERYIVAVAPHYDRDNGLFYLTSHNSVFETGQRDEISRALERTSR